MQEHTLFGVVVRTRLPFGALRRAASLYLAGDRPGDICAAVSRGGVTLSRQQLQSLMRRLGILRTKSAAMRLLHSQRAGRDYDALAAEAVRLYTDEDESTCSVAELLGVSKTFVRQAIAGAGRSTRSLGRAQLVAVQTGRHRWAA